MLIKALAAAAGNFGGGYSIENSLRFNDNDSANLSRTPSVAGDRKTLTWSGWVKRGNLVTGQLFNTGVSGDNDFGISLTTSDTIEIYGYASGGYVYRLITTPVFRDVSGWYHVVVSIDTTDATSSNRVKLWVNGQQITAFSTASYPALNLDTYFNTTQVHRIGSRYNGIAAFFDGYIAETNFIDGQALTADDFGQIDETTGEWSPKKYLGTYGTNGFYLPFKGNANDSSGNGNNWTENNLASTDYMIDTPTNNFSVLNPLASDEVTLQEGNLEATLLTTAPRSAITTMPVSSGKWYAEVYYNSNTGNALLLGVVTDSYSPVSGTTRAHQVSSGGGSVGYFSSDGDKLIDNVRTAYGSSATTGDILGIAFNLDDDEITFYKNNVSQGTITTKAFSGGYNFFLSNGSSNGNQVATLNQGADSSFAGVKTRQGNTDANGIGDFYYTPPTGYLALCTDNLAEPAIEQPETQFNVVTYTGTGGTQAITGLEFQPDFVWIKNRSRNGSFHILQDSLRGAGKSLFSNETNAESGNAGDLIASLDSNGFTVNENYLGATTNFSTNASGDTYVAWCWKAGGTAVTNTNGTITSQVSANVDAGFSIASYTGTGSNASVGHGLEQKPDLVIVKSRNSVAGWFVQQYVYAPSGNAAYGYLNTTAAFIGFTDTLTTDSVFQQGGGNGVTYVAYCFHSVEGFSKIGTYIGNGSSTNGTFVYTGFKPAFVMVKRTDGVGSWYMEDSARNPSNPTDLYLEAPFANAEGSLNPSFDFLSNGFKLRTANANFNGSGATFIYMAFAEHPFNYSTGR